MLPLSGTKVIAWTNVVAGPFGGMVFADLGAEVILIERERGRRNSPAEERNKKSIVLDLRKDEGKEILRRLLESADFFFENYAPGAADRLGFSYEAVSKLNPRIIYISLKGYGDRGPYGTRGGNDPVIETETGLINVIGAKDPTRPPCRIGASTIDVTTAQFAVMTALAGMLNREKTGKGCYIKTFLYEDAVCILSEHLVLQQLYGREFGRSGSGTGASQHFKTRDKWIYVDASADATWQGFCDAFDVADDVRKEFAADVAREKNPEKIGAIMADVLSGVKAREAIEKLVKTGVPCAQVNTFKEVMEDPHLLATKSLVPLQTDPEVTGKWYRRTSVGVMLPLRASFYNPSVEGWGGKAMPRRGEHTDEVLHGLGYSEAQIADLHKNKIVYP